MHSMSAKEREEREERGELDFSGARGMQSESRFWCEPVRICVVTGGKAVAAGQGAPAEEKGSSLLYTRV